MAQLTYRKPAPADRNLVLAFMDAFYAAGEDTVNGSAGLDFFKDYDKWLAYLEDIAAGREEGLVPSVVYLALCAGEMVGILDIRPTLPPEKYHWGHLGYSVAPAHRGHGHAVQMARWAVDALRADGVQTVRANCYATNLSSAGVLRRAGFTPDGDYTEDDTGKRVLKFIQ